ncbi:MAG: UDP-N-acetylglucosamine 2-epimerase (non-hydrolyzing) [Phreatobacter sp.]|nr:UDP-N-acetylglucosamine 2-epimerase (non-hydrolyzing) [Phreatobacter sp.]
MRKVMSIVGTRPEIIKMSRVLALLDKHTDHVLVHTGQNFDYNLNEVFFRDLELRAPDFYLGAAGGTAIATIAEVLLRTDEVMEQVKPEAVLIYGDTNSGLSVIAAKRRKLPVFHMEAGNRCFDQRVPEELNRKVIDHLSDVNMVLTEHARRYLIAEGLPPELVFKVGSHMEEVLQHFRPAILASDILAQLGLDERRYFLVSSHREENVDVPRNLLSLLDGLNGLCETYGDPVVFSTHPRTRKRIKALEGVTLDPRIRFLEPFGFHDYNRLQMGARCVVSDSGTITEESSLLGFPSVTIRQAHERPEGMDEGTLVMCGLERAGLLDAVRFVIACAGDAPLQARPVQDYQAGPVSRKVVAIVLSYIDYVNRVIWRKS